MTYQIAVLAGDGIGPEIIDQALKVLNVFVKERLPLEFSHALVGGSAYEKFGEPLPSSTLTLAQSADAILFGAVGDWKYDTLERKYRPEQAILGLRKSLGLFANLRPALLFNELAQASSLKREIISGLDLLIVRELTGDIYFGQPRGIHTLDSGEREGINTMRYSEFEVRRIAKVAFETASLRSKRLCSVDKANVLETSQLWREVMISVAAEYPQVQLSHMYVDNAAMQLIKAPKSFDVIVTGNMFGDILSDQASMLTGSIGMLASASLNHEKRGLYEPAHGSAPDIAGQNKANPLATILSAALMLRYSLGLEPYAKRIEAAVQQTIKAGYRTADIATQTESSISCSAMGDAVADFVSIQRNS